MKKVLFMQPTNSTFMETDYKILCSKYSADRIILNQTNKFEYCRKLCRLVLSIFALRKYDAFVVWFGDYHSAIAAFLAKILHKKMVLFIGGYDAVYYPDKNIGVYNNAIRGRVCKYAITHSDLIIANHGSLIESNNRYIDNTDRPSGLKNIIKNFKGHYKVIYNGIDVSKADAFDKVKNPRLVLTTGATPKWEDIYNKGYDILIEVARLLPEFEFVFVNISHSRLKRLEKEYNYSNVPNLKIYSYIPWEELLDLFNKAKVYAQPSISEGMPYALVEAMLFECIPVGSNVAGIPTVIDKYGIILNERNVSKLADAIKQAADMDTGKMASAYIRQNFSIELRTIKIIKAIDEILKD